MNSWSTGSPLRSVPFALPASRRMTPSGVTSSSACLRLTEPSSISIVFPGTRPTETVPCSGNVRPAQGPVSPLSIGPSPTAPRASAGFRTTASSSAPRAAPCAPGLRARGEAAVAPLGMDRSSGAPRLPLFRRASEDEPDAGERREGAPRS